MKKQLIAKLLVLCMVVSMLPVAVFAADNGIGGPTNARANSGYPTDNDTYYVDDDSDVPTTTTPDKATVSEPSTSGAVEVKVESTGGTATVGKADMDKAVSDAVAAAAKAGTAPVVTLKTTAPTMNIPAASLKALSDGKGSMDIGLNNGDGNVNLDSACLAALVAQGGEMVTASMRPIEAAALSSAQKEAVKGATVIDVSITSGGKQITNFNGGTLSISVAYTLPSGVTAANVQVYYMNDKGILQAYGYETSYSGGKVSFKTTHLSKYVIGTKDLSGMTFTDVSVKDWYFDAVAWAAKNKVASGTSTTAATFTPGKDCSRAEIVTFLWRAANSPEPASTNNPFTDVDSSAYYYKAVLWAVEKKITEGTTETTFSPDKGCTRAEAMTFLHRSENKPTASGVSFTDVPAGAWYSDAAAWAAKNGIAFGTSTTTSTFSPDKTCTRSEIVTFMFRNAL